VEKPRSIVIAGSRTNEGSADSWAKGSSQASCRREQQGDTVLNSTSGTRSLTLFFSQVHGRSFELGIYVIARSQRWIAEFRAPG